MKIQCTSTHTTCRFAAKELASYLSRMGHPALSYELEVTDLTATGLPKVADQSLDDQYLIG